MPDPSIAVLRPGALFHERYEVVRCINAGSMGAVYEVIDKKTESPRALKVMLPEIVEDADLRSRFEREARITGNIDSDHLVRVSDAGIDAETGTPFLVMDLLRGEELGSMVRKRSALSPAEVVLYLYQTALALDKTHAAGIVHRDLKPENMFVTYRDDGSPCIKILDFGIAKVVVESNQARVTRPMGTPVYMAPEQIEGEGIVGPRTDIYAMGHIAYTLLTGEPYWIEESKGATLYSLLSKIKGGMKEAATARAARRFGVSLPSAFDVWFVKTTAVRPDQRFELAMDVVVALASVLGVPNPKLSMAKAELLETSRDGRAASASRPSSDSDMALHTTVPAPGSPERGGMALATTMPVTTSPRANAPASRAGRRIGVIAAAAGLAAIAAVALRSGLDAGPAMPSSGASAASVTPRAEPSSASPSVEPATLPSTRPDPIALPSASSSAGQTAPAAPSAQSPLPGPSALPISRPPPWGTAKTDSPRPSASSKHEGIF